MRALFYSLMQVVDVTHVLLALREEKSPYERYSRNKCLLRDTYLKCYTVSQQSRTSFLPNLRRSFVSYHIIGKNYYYIFDAGDFSFLNASSRCYSCTTGIKRRKKPA